MSDYGTSPIIVTDNFSTGAHHSPAGYIGTLADYFGGFVGTITKKSTDTFENNYFYNSTVGTCTSIVSVNKPTCTSVANASVFNDITQGVYTRANNSWDFANTWREVTGGLPVLR